MLALCLRIDNRQRFWPGPEVHESIVFLLEGLNYHYCGKRFKVSEDNGERKSIREDGFKSTLLPTVRMITTSYPEMTMVRLED